ncbi:hypothetical protein [Actinoplanes sp. NPDC051859]|uniref:hypothetical protein n=1 Tax=Actinoplanes sp. NPDC051859 TaxID=3363909 RepID=UPI003796CBA9
MDVPDSLGQLDAGDMSHGLLLALLQQYHPGGAVLEIAGLERAMGDTEGRMYSVIMEPVDFQYVRLIVARVGRDQDGLH